MSGYRRDGDEFDTVVTPSIPPAARARPVVVEPPVVEPPVVEPVVADQPVVGRPAAVAPTVVTPAVAPPVTVVREPAVVASDQVVRRSFTAFSASQIVHGIAAAILLVIGAVVVARGGFDGNASEQVGSFLGMETTTPIGLAILAAGLLLTIAALTPSGRPFGGFVGALVAVGGVVLVAAGRDLSDDLRTDTTLGWVLLVIGIACIVAAFLPDEVRARRQQVVVR